MLHYMISGLEAQKTVAQGEGYVDSAVDACRRSVFKGIFDKCEHKHRRYPERVIVDIEIPVNGGVAVETYSLKVDIA